MPLESLHIPGFSSPLTKNRNRHGGGVALYVLSSLAAIRRVDLECDEFEIKWVEFKLAKLFCAFLAKQVFCGVCYRPPGRDIAYFERFLDTLQTPTTKFVMFVTLLLS